MELARKELELARKELELARKELELEQKELELKEKRAQLDTDSSESHNDLYDSFDAEPPLSDDEEETRRVKILAKFNKRRQLDTVSSKRAQLDTGSSEGHAKQLMKDLYDVLHAEPPLSDEEQKRRLKIIVKWHVMHTQERDRATVGRILAKLNKRPTQERDEATVGRV